LRLPGEAVETFGQVYDQVAPSRFAHK
jgi:hypothetical protein